LIVEMQYNGIIVFTFSLLVVYIQAQSTVQDEINKGGCTTSVIAPLSKQLVASTNALHPTGTLFTDLNTLSGVNISADAAVVPFLQISAANALQAAIAKQGLTMTIISALRTLPQQLMLYKWFLNNQQCGITAAVPPGHSAHNAGLAVEIADREVWRKVMSDNQWMQRDQSNQFEYKGSDALNILPLSVKAFQVLWNNNNQNNSIPEDGFYVPATQRAVLASPANGW